MRPRHKVSKAGLELVENFEGLRRKAARLPDGRWTIGYGHTLSAREGAEVTPEDAEALLRFDLLPIVEAVNNLVFTPINQNQFDALVAFAFNVGVEEFRQSEVLKRVNEGRLTEAACALDLWRRAEVGGDRIVLDALIRRRAAEKALFLTPIEGFVPTPSPLVRPAVDPDAVHLLPQRPPVEIETPLEGEHAHVRRLGPVEAAPAVAPVLGAAAPALEAFESAPEPAPAAEPRAAEPPAEAAPFAPFPGEPANDVPAGPLEAEQATEPGAEALAVVAAPAAAQDYAAEVAEAEAALVEPAEAPAPTPVVEPEPEPVVSAEPAEPQPVPAPELAPVPAQSIAEAVMSSRLYASYGPMAIPAMPPRAGLATLNGAPVAPTAPSEPAVAAEPVSTFGPPFVPQAAALAELAPQPAITSSIQPAAAPLVLTPPPEDIPQPQQPAAAPPPPLTAFAAEADEFSTPLFDDGWDAAEALGGRIVRHETPEEEETDGGHRVANGPYILLGAIGLAAFVGAVGAFLKASAGAGHGGGPFDNPAIYAWALAIIGAACVGSSIYFLLKRLGGVED